MSLKLSLLTVMRKKYPTLTIEHIAHKHNYYKHNHEMKRTNSSNFLIVSGTLTKLLPTRKPSLIINSSSQKLFYSSTFTSLATFYFVSRLMKHRLFVRGLDDIRVHSPNAAFALRKGVTWGILTALAWNRVTLLPHGLIHELINISTFLHPPPPYINCHL